MKFDQSLLNIKIHGVSLDRIGHNCKDTFFKFVRVRINEYLNLDQHAKYIL